MLKGANASGVTIGTGVDLGQQDPAEYSKRLKAFGAQQTLIDKLEPYMGLTRGQAAEYLREHPLTVTKQEADLLDEEMKSYHLADTIAEYNSIAEATKDRKEFSKLSSQEQTILFSRHYQDGNISNKTTPSKEIAVSLSKGNVEAALKKLNTSNYRSSAHKDRIPREHDYLQRWFQTIDTEAPKTKPAAAEKATP